MVNTILTVTLAVLGLLMLITFYIVIKGPRFTDRIVAVNAENTMAIACICLLSRLLDADYLIDVALIYALLGLVANTLLTRIMLAKKREEDEK